VPRAFQLLLAAADPRGPAQLFFSYAASLDRRTFSALQDACGLTTPFHELPDLVASLAAACRDDPAGHFAVLTLLAPARGGPRPGGGASCHAGAAARLDFVRDLGFKFVELLTVTLAACPEPAVRASVGARYGALVARAAALEAEHEALAGIVRRRAPAVWQQFLERRAAAVAAAAAAEAEAEAGEGAEAAEVLASPPAWAAARAASPPPGVRRAGQGAPAAPATPPAGGTPAPAPPKPWIGPLGRSSAPAEGHAAARPGSARAPQSPCASGRAARRDPGAPQVLAPDTRSAQPPLSPSGRPGPQHQQGSYCARAAGAAAAATAAAKRAGRAAAARAAGAPGGGCVPPPEDEEAGEEAAEQLLQAAIAAYYYAK
jgi:hypothetical protein